MQIIQKGQNFSNKVDESCKYSIDNLALKRNILRLLLFLGICVLCPKYVRDNSNENQFVTKKQK